MSTLSRMLRIAIQISVFQGTQVQNLVAIRTTQVQNLFATQTIERTNALHAFERSQAAGKAYRV